MTKEEKKALRLEEAIERTNKKFSNKKKKTLKTKKEPILIKPNKIGISLFLDRGDVVNVHFHGEIKQYHSVIELSAFIARDIEERVKELKKDGFIIDFNQVRIVKDKCRETLIKFQNTILKRCNTCNTNKTLSSYYLVSHNYHSVKCFVNKCKDCTQKYAKMKILEQRIMENRKDVPASKTYLMKDNLTKLYKIGKSKKPKIREATLQSEKPSIKMVKVWESDIESKLHNKYHRQRVRGEWFSLNKIQVRYICTHF